MTDFQLGLLGIGVAVVAAVLVYNRIQESRGRREAQRAFASQDADALLDEPSDDLKAPAKAVARRNQWHVGDLPDPTIDYVVDLEVARGTLSATVLENWKPLEHRFAGAAHLAGSGGGDWSDVVAGDVRSLTALRAGLQMVSRSGVVSEATLLEFRSALDTFGAALGARVAAPEMREALDAARALDKLCVDADIQVALHVVGGAPQDTLEIAAALDAFAFQVEPRADGLSLVLDVPRSGHAPAFEAMARAARDLAAKSGGRVVDDNGHELDERSLAAINAEVTAVRARLAASGIEAGSPLALRLFS